MTESAQLLDAFDGVTLAGDDLLAYDRYRHGEVDVSPSLFRRRQIARDQVALTLEQRRDQPLAGVDVDEQWLESALFGIAADEVDLEVQ